MKKMLLMWLAVGLLPLASARAAEGDIQLPTPKTTGGMPLMEALQARQSQRVLKADKLAPEMLANLLWAANGVNRTNGKRTAPSAMDMREIEVYVAMAEGVFRYDADKNLLQRVQKADLRAACGKQGFVKDAPVVLVYVASGAKMATLSPEARVKYSHTDTAFISQNVYLFCASEKLATVVLGYVDMPALEKALGLAADQSVILTQPVGWPRGGSKS